MCGIYAALAKRKQHSRFEVKEKTVQVSTFLYLYLQVSSFYKEQLTQLMTTLHATEPHFIRYE